MRTPRYNDVPVFGDDIRTVRRGYADYAGLLRCCWLSVLFVLFFIVTVNCLFLGLYLLYPLDPPAATNVLVLGVDTRADGNDTIDIGRTDSIMVVSIDPQRKQMAALSIPRDLILNSPVYGRLRANTVVRNAELNAPGTGLDEMQDAVENTFDIDIDHVVRVDFEGFVDVIDALGGVEIDVPKRIVDTQYPLPDDSGVTTVRFEPGLQWMSGETALVYARTRQADDDYQRAGRQQQVVAAALRKFEDPVVWLRLPMVLNAAQAHTDSDVGFADMLRYVPGALRYGRNIEMLVITREYIEIDGSVSLPDVSSLRPWLDENLVHTGPTAQ